MDCIFCKIASGEIPTDVIHEDDDIIAFDDLYPKAPIHKLIIPKKHIATLNDLDNGDVATAGKLLFAAKHIAQQLNIAEDGYRVIMNCNKGGGQEIYHIHLHLLGGRPMKWPPG